MLATCLRRSLPAVGLPRRIIRSSFKLLLLVIATYCLIIVYRTTVVIPSERLEWQALEGGGLVVGVVNSHVNQTNAGHTGGSATNARLPVGVVLATDIVKENVSQMITGYKGGPRESVNQTASASARKLKSKPDPVVSSTIRTTVSTPRSTFAKDSPNLLSSVMERPILKDNIISSLLLSNERRCPDNRRPSPSSIDSVQNGAWQRYNFSSEDKMYIFSAHFDERLSRRRTNHSDLNPPLPPPGSPSDRPYLRLLVIVTKTSETNLSFVCHVWYVGLVEPYIVPAEIDDTGQVMHTENDINYFELTISCPLPPVNMTSSVPERVTLVSMATVCNDVTKVTTTYVPVTRVLSDGFEGSGFGICVANGYGTVDSTAFIEWMEMHAMLGVSHVTLYDTDFDLGIYNVFEYYKRKGMLEVHRLPHPVAPPRPPHISPHFPQNSDIFYINRIRNLRTISLNDCAMRSAFVRRWIVVVDLDEVIVPRHTMNYTSMLAEIDERLALTRPPRSYTFKNMYFLSDFPQDASRPTHHRMLRFRSRAQPSDKYLAPKSIVDPRQCFNVFNHYCLRRMIMDDGSKPPPGELPPVFAPPAIAGSHHYRKCGQFYAVTCEQLMKQRVLDNIMLKYEEVLTKRVNQVLAELGMKPRQSEGRKETKEANKL